MIRLTAHLLLLLPALGLAYELADPAFATVRDWLAPLLLALGLTFFLWRISVRDLARKAVALAWLAVAALAGMSMLMDWSARAEVFRAAAREPAQMAALGQHLVIGYDRPDEVRELARRGLIGGLFVTQRNIAGKSADQLRTELADLQAVRRSAGLPPLMIATDQEGGPVSRLSPLVPRQPPLAELAGRPDAERDAADYGRRQAEALSRLGINVNFSPVVDLKPDRPPSPLDQHTRIAERAIAADPGTVSRIALAYSRALAEHGVTPTLKHFPGLRDVREDTHLRDAHLAASVEQLARRDWQAFRYVLDRTPAMLMVGHATLDAIDPSHPASLSHAVLTGLLRDRWLYDGILISDDMSMAPVYDRGLCRASVEALNAGQDLLLIAYDWRKYYVVMDCLQRAEAVSKLTDLGGSNRRLRAQAWRQGAAPHIGKRT